ncbi:hypothetical protein MMC10_006079 [Thelotrema lepadinum]|nr:hypothetical protein [Thelotrema lepadinum]
MNKIHLPVELHPSSQLFQPPTTSTTLFSLHTSHSGHVHKGKSPVPVSLRPHRAEESLNDEHDTTDVHERPETFLPEASQSPPHRPAERGENHPQHDQPKQYPQIDVGFGSETFSFAPQVASASQGGPVSSLDDDQAPYQETEEVRGPSQLSLQAHSSQLFKSLSYPDLTSKGVIDGFRYDLRPWTPRDPSDFEALYDVDDSGTFNPKRPISGIEGNRLKRSRSNIEVTSKSEGRSPKKQRSLSVVYGRWTDEHCPVTIHFSQDILDSANGKRLRDAMKESEDNWPYYMTDLSLPEENFTELSLSTIQPRKLRTRKETARESLINDGVYMSEPTLGHPAARGCKACFQIGVRCNLLDDDETWPCLHCVDGGEECELFLEPLEKNACEHCKRRRLPCSFRRNEEHQGPCSQCSQKGFKCVAGPKSGRVRTGPSLDVIFGSLASSRCSSRAESTTTDQSDLLFHPIDHHHETYLCDDGDSSYQNRQRPRSSFLSLWFQSNPDKMSDAIEGVEIEGHAQGSNQGCTSGAAPTPIDGMMKPGELQSLYMNLTVSTEEETCGWCEHPACGLEGFPVNAATTLERTLMRCLIHDKVCVECVDTRLAIVHCESHTMVPLDKAITDAIPDEGLWEIWVDPGDAKQPGFEWCSVCCQPAYHTCDTPHKGHRGCGLKLCGGCKERLEAAGGDLGLTIKRMRRAQAGLVGVAPLRVDVGMLLEDGAFYKLATRDPESV